VVHPRPGEATAAAAAAAIGGAALGHGGALGHSDDDGGGCDGRYGTYTSWYDRYRFTRP